MKSSCFTHWSLQSPDSHNILASQPGAETTGLLSHLPVGLEPRASRDLWPQVPLVELQPGGEISSPVVWCPYLTVQRNLKGLQDDSRNSTLQDRIGWNQQPRTSGPASKSQTIRTGWSYDRTEVPVKVTTALLWWLQKLNSLHTAEAWGDSSPALVTPEAD